MVTPFPEFTFQIDTPQRFSELTGAHCFPGPRFRSLDPARSGLHCFPIVILVSSPLTNATRRIRCALIWLILARLVRRRGLWRPVVR
jgi:hypothetical protein